MTSRTGDCYANGVRYCCEAEVELGDGRVQKCGIDGTSPDRPTKNCRGGGNVRQHEPGGAGLACHLDGAVAVAWAMSYFRCKCSAKQIKG